MNRTKYNSCRKILRTPTKLNNLTSEVKNFNPSNNNLIKRTKDFKDSKDLTDHNIISNSFLQKKKKVT